MNKINSRITFVVLTALLVGGFPNFMAQEAFAATSSLTTGATAGDSTATTNIVIVFSTAIFSEDGVDGVQQNKNGLFSVSGNTVDTANIIARSSDSCTGGGTTSVTLVVGTALATDATPTVSFTNDGTVGICDSNATNNDEPNFSSSATTDGLSPQFSSASASGTTVSVVFTETIDDAGTVAITDFTLTGNTLTGTPSVSGTTVTLTVSTEISVGDTLTIAYTETNGDLEDAANNFVRTFTAQSVTNNAVAPSTSNNGSGCNDCEAPTLGINSDSRRIVEDGFSYNGNSVDAERFFTPYPLITAQVGKQNTAVFKIYEDKGPENIKHFSFAFGLDKGQYIGESKAMIELDIDHEGTETVTVTDPENTLDNIKVSTNITNCNEDDSDTQCLIVTIEHRFRAPLDFNIVGTDVWDMKRNAWQNYFNHGIQVTGESLNPPKEHDGIYQGQFYHLTETSKTSAVDEKGDSWSFQYGVWNKDFIPNKKSSDKITMHGYDRGTYGFDMYKYGQHLLAEITLNEICPNCNDTSFDKINNIFAYDYPIVQNSLDDPNIKSKIIFESEKAQKIINAIVNPYQE